MSCASTLSTVGYSTTPSPMRSVAFQYASWRRSKRNDGSGIDLTSSNSARRASVYWTRVARTLFQDPVEGERASSTAAMYASRCGVVGGGGRGGGGEDGRPEAPPAGEPNGDEEPAAGALRGGLGREPN